MTTLFRIRRLTQTGAGVVDAEGRGLVNAAVAQAGAVYDVASSDFEVPEAQVLEALRKGTLRTTDLVFQDGVWCSLADSIHFSDECAKHAGGESVRRNVGNVALVLLAFGVMGALIFFRLLFRAS